MKKTQSEINPTTSPLYPVYVRTKPTHPRRETPHIFKLYNPAPPPFDQAKNTVTRRRAHFDKLKFSISAVAIAATALTLVAYEQFHKPALLTPQLYAAQTKAAVSL